MKKIYRGMPDGCESIQANFDELDNYNKDIQTQLIALGYGITGQLTKIGQTVHLTVWNNQSSPRPDGMNTLTERIPKGFEPIALTPVIGEMVIGSALEPWWLLYKFSPDGTIVSYSKGLNVQPVTIAMTAMWITKN
ncbi:hypothetical protein ACSFB8_07370 [Enterococcus faecalis]